MKRFLALLIALTVLVGAFAFAEEPSSAALPAVGDTVEGFTVKEIRDFPLIGATLVYFEHDRTGARLIYLANNDTNRVFDLTFFTRAENNTGLPHVFEHATLDGSAKYPSKALFFNLSYQTYNTYMNASTYPLMTTYPVASLSEAQLLKYADYYTDSCLNPMIMEDESIFREEAWRYRMSDMDSELTIEGTVYSEMLGAITLDSAAYTNMLRTAFPGSTIGNESGGEPEYIPDMTWEMLRDYHDKYYHPSNCTAFLYGEFEDYTAFLKLLDDAFAPYEKREFTFDDAGYSPVTEPVEAAYAYPVESGSTTEHSSTVYYAIVCPGLKDDPQEELLLNTFTDLAGAGASPFYQALIKVLPYGEFGCYIESEGPEDAIVFYAANLNAEDAPLYKATIDECFAQTAESGFPQDLVDSVMANLSLSTKLTGESSEVGVNIIPDIAYYYSASGRPFDYLDYVEGLEKLDEWNGEGLYAEACAKWLVGSATTALVTTYPEPGLKEINDQAEVERLADVKANMSENELLAIIEQSNSTDEPDDTSEYVASLQAVTVDSLPEEIRLYDVDDTTGDDGVRRLTVEAGVDGVGRTALFLDAGGLEQDQIHWFALYNSLLGEVDTSSHTHEELAVLETRYLYGGEIRLSLLGNPAVSDDYAPYLRFGWTSTNEDLETGYDLMYEILFDSQFEDAEYILGLVSQRKASLKSAITNGSYSVQLYRAFGVYSPLYRYYSYFNYLEYYAFLEEAEAMLTEDPETALAALRGVQNYFRNRTNAMAVFAGDENGIELNDELTVQFFAKLDSTSIEAVDYDLPVPAKHEALIIDSAVQFNGVVADFDAMGIEGFTGDMDAVSALVNDMYLLPQLRDQYGAYGVMHGWLPEVGAYIVSYRDPNVTETFDVYAELPAFVDGLETDQETIDGYILSSYSQYAASDGELSGAISAMLGVLSEDPADLNLQYMRELKTVVPDAVRAYADTYSALVNEGVTFTSGSASAINAHADLYDAILNPFGAQDASEVVFTDIAEDDPAYEDVRYVFENGLMKPVDDVSFGSENEATVGELAGALYMLVGGDVEAQDEAIEFLAEYGIIPGSSASGDVLTATNAELILANFSEAIGVPYEGSSEAADDPLTRGGLASVLAAYVQTLE